MDDISDIPRAVARKQAFERQLELFYHRCPIDVLVVADSFLYFNDEDFGLSDFLGILAAAPRRVRFRITKAHRGNPGVTRLAGATPNYVFTDASLANFDQVWMFAAGSDPIAPEEVLAITRFMQAGGGVFATGDHENLGVGMCGEIPRVRSMRKWYWPNPGPLGEPVAPDGGSASRHDTNRPGRNAAFSFDDQSDAIPQDITPKLYTRRLSRFIQERYPHPLLCGPHGTIRVLPDHPHEGECIVPALLDRELDVGPPGGQLRVTEYPPDGGGLPVAPEVIATSRMLPGAAVPEFGKPAIPGGTFGAIGAYDGHRAGVGRVVVDATWHHFININLTGASNGSDAEKDLGFLYAATLPAGDPERVRIERDYAQIRAYFQNIGMWIAPAPKQQCTSRWALRYVARSYPLIEELATAHLRPLKFDDYVAIGAAGFEALRTFTRPCGALRIVIDYLPPPLRRWPIPIDPWEPPPWKGPGPRPEPELPALGFDLHALELANLGAVLVELHRIGDPPEDMGDEANAALDRVIAKAAVAGQRKGYTLLGEAITNGVATIAALAKATDLDPRQCAEAD
jgi:hypothetical protein